MVFSHYLQLFSHYRWIAFWIVFSTTGLAAGALTLLLYVFPMYTGSTTIVMKPTQEELAFTKGWLSGSTYNPANINVSTHIEYLMSRPVAELALDKLLATLEKQPPKTGWKAEWGQRINKAYIGVMRLYRTLNSGKFVKVSEREDALGMLMEGIEVEMIEGSYVLLIEVTLPSAKAAAMAANALADAYVERLEYDANQASLKLEKFLQSEISKRQAGATNLATVNNEINQLHNRILEVRLGRSSVLSQLRKVNPATVPHYPSFPKVVIYTAIALAASILLSIFVIVLLDTTTGTIKTTADLRRIVGGRGIGTLPYSLLKALCRKTWHLSPWKSHRLRNFGQELETNLAILGGFYESDAIYVTGFGESPKISAAALTIGRALAARGVKVQCLFGLTAINNHLPPERRNEVFPENETPRTNQRSSNLLIQQTPNVRNFTELADSTAPTKNLLKPIVPDNLFLPEHLNEPPSENDTSTTNQGSNDLLIQQPQDDDKSTELASNSPPTKILGLSPLAGKFNWNQLDSGTKSIICLLPAGAIEEETVLELVHTAKQHNITAVGFILVR